MVPCPYRRSRTERSILHRYMSINNSIWQDTSGQMPFNLMCVGHVFRDTTNLVLLQATTPNKSRWHSTSHRWKTDLRSHKRFTECNTDITRETEKHMIQEDEKLNLGSWKSSSCQDCGIWNWWYIKALQNVSRRTRRITSPAQSWYSGIHRQEGKW